LFSLNLGGVIVGKAGRAEKGELSGKTAPPTNLASTDIVGGRGRKPREETGRALKGTGG